MKTKVNVHEAKTHLSKLLRRVMAGEEITIAKAGVPVARLTPIHKSLSQRAPGSAQGLIKIEPSFDEPLPEEVLRSFER